MEIALTPFITKAMEYGVVGVYAIIVTVAYFLCGKSKADIQEKRIQEAKEIMRTVERFESTVDKLVDSNDSLKEAIQLVLYHKRG